MRGEGALSSSGSGVMPFVIVSGSLEIAENILAAARSFAHARYALRHEHAIPLYHRSDAVILCGTARSICDWSGQIDRNGVTGVTVAAIRPQSFRFIEQLFGAGIHDIVTSRMGRLELVAHLKAAILRRRRFEVKTMGGPISLVNSRRATVRLYEYLRHNPGRVIGQGELIERVFGGAHAEDTSLVRVHIAAVRKALGRASHMIKTVRGAGYCYVAE